MGQGGSLTRRAFLAATSVAAVTACSTAERARTSLAVQTSGPAPVGPSPSPSPSPTRTAAWPRHPHAERTRLPDTHDPAVVASRATVPVLCWHQLRRWRPDDTAYTRSLLVCPPARFRAQLDALARAGYTTIGPDRYLEHMLTGAALPARPVMLSFDDSQGSQVTEGLPQLVRRGMTATFFVMTVVLGNPGWMTRDDLRRLRDAGMTVAAHTWDHHRADRYRGTDWAVQLDRPRALLEGVLRQPVPHFAYPYGAWDDGDFPHLAAAGYRTAFQLADRPVHPSRPLYTLRRTLVGSTWTGPDLLAQLPRPA